MECESIDVIILRPEDQDLGNKDLIRASPLKKQMPWLSIPVIYLYRKADSPKHNCLL